MKTSLTLSLTLATTLSIAASAQAQDAGDPAEGEKVFKRCTACHQVGDDAKNRVGPVLNGVVGRQAGSYDGYKYGKSMIEAGEAGLVWNEENIAIYISDPTSFLKEYLADDKARGKMTFKLPKEEDRANVIAYIATF